MELTLFWDLLHYTHYFAALKMQTQLPSLPPKEVSHFRIVKDTVQFWVQNVKQYVFMV